MKKIIATLLLGVTLCGGMLTVQAATSSTFSAHVHQYQKVFDGTIRSVNNTHQYVSGVYRDEYGNITGYEFGTCYITTKLNKYIYKCSGCSATKDAGTDTETIHSVSH